MNKLQLVKSDKFGNTEFDIYSDNKEMYMTAEQLGECLDYCNPRESINKLVQRNEYLRNAEFSVEVKMTSTDGKRYNTRVFTEDGIYEVTMLAKTERAKEFRARVRAVLKALRSGEITTGKSLETSEYHYFDKTYRGERVITLADFEHFTGVGRCAALSCIKTNCNSGADYVVLEKGELSAFKIENPSISKRFSALTVLKRSAVEKLLTYYNSNVKFSFFETEDKKAVPAVVDTPTPEPKMPKTDECIVALNVLRWLKFQDERWLAEDRMHGGTHMTEAYKRDISALESAIKSVGSLVAAGY